MLRVNKNFKILIMIEKEFNKIKSIKNKTDNLEKILYDNLRILENSKIQKLLILYTMFGDISISKELSDTILKIIENESEKI